MKKRDNCDRSVCFDGSDSAWIIVKGFEMGDLQKKRKILKGHRGYAAKEVEMIDGIIAGESKEKE